MPQDRDSKRAADLDLWRVSVSGVKPLQARKREVAVKASSPASSAPKKAAKPPAKKTWTKVELTPPAPVTKPAPLNAPAFAAPDRKTKRALSKGKKTVEATLDLHGHTQEKAYAALRRFLLHAHTNNQRLVRVITGKGKKEGEGILRKKLLHWLEADKALAPLILAVEEAAPHHGGAGAFNLWLRK